ncbi:TPA: GNAT family N-acetyltransferase [Legionella pneumophila]
MISQRQSLEFKPLELDDLKLIFNWFKVPEIKKWYAQGKEWSLSDIEAKYKPRLIDQEVVPSFIINLDSKNIGFIQYYPLSKTTMPEGLSYDEAVRLNVDMRNSVGIDLFIGEESLIGIGLGKVIIRDFIKNILPKNYTRIFIDPTKSNARAVKAYKKVGFKEYSHQGNEKICLMLAERDDLSIRVVNKPNSSQYNKCFTGCIILSNDKRILLQKRPQHWHPYPEYITTFGGRIEKEETPTQAIVRELYEELGAKIPPEELVELEAITEPCTGHTELVYEYFWYDKNNLITGCYEGIAMYFDNIEKILSQQKIMDDIEWLINECRKRKLLPN